MQLYRLERYDECKSVYTDLIRNSQDEYEEERKTNLAAVVAAMSQWEKAPMVSIHWHSSSVSFSFEFLNQKLTPTTLLHRTGVGLFE